MKEYIKHDYGASRDQSIQILMLKHGAKAYGMYWIIVEAMYEACGTLAEAVLKNVVAMSKVRNGMQVFDTMLELGLFEEIDGGYTSNRIQNALLERDKISDVRSNAAKIKHANAKQKQSKSNAINSNSIVYTPLTPQGGEVRVSTEIPTPTTEEEKIEARLHVAKKYAPTVDDVVTYGLSRGIPQAEMIEFWDWHDQRGWTLSDGKPVVKWRVRFDSWMRKKGLMP